MFLLSLLLLKDNFLDNNYNCIHLKPCRYYTLNPRNNSKCNLSLPNPINQTPLHSISPQMSDLLEKVSEIQVPLLLEMVKAQRLWATKAKTRCCPEYHFHWRQMKTEELSYS